MPINNEKYLLRIIQKCPSGKARKKEWEELYKYCFRKIYVFLKGFYLKMNLPFVDLEDITQDIFIKLIEKFPDKEFKSMRDFNKYLDAICKNYTIDYLRKYKNRKYVMPLEDYEKIIVDPGYLRQFQAYELKELRGLLIKGIKKLPVQCRKILNPLLKEDITLAEIARRYEIPEGTIYTQYRRCIQKLKKILESM